MPEYVVHARQAQRTMSVEGAEVPIANLAIGINRVAIAVNHDDELLIIRNSGGKESKAEIAVDGGCAASASASAASASASASASAFGKASMLESDCDRSQSSVSGASWGRSSFRATTRAGKIDLRSPRWMDRGGHHHQQGNNGHGSLTDDNAVVSFPTIKRKFSAGSHENNNRDRASPSSHQTDAAHDSHDEGYLSHSTADGGYQSGGYHSYHHPALSYAPSVKSDIATVCSGSVVEDIDMAEVASVASDGGGKKGIPPQFASNILNDMGPPQTLCSALLLAANAACRPSSASLRSFDINDDKSAVSDVVAHVDTDDCCDRSVTQSEVSTLHSQDDMTSEHKEEMMDESVNDMSPEAGLKGSLLHHTSEPSLAPVNSRRSRGENYNLQRFRHGHLPEDGANHLQLPEDGTFNPWGQEYFDRGREDDWSNSRSRSLSRSPSRSLSPSSSCSRSRSRSRSRSPDRNTRRITRKKE